MMKRILTFCLMLAQCAGSSAQLRYEIPFPKPIQKICDTVSIAIIGDVMMHSAQLGYDSSAFLEDIGNWLRDCDFACANMEFTLAGKPYSGYPSFSAPDEYAKNITDSGINVFLTANNHILDKGSGGMERTLGIYRSLGVPFTGSAGSREEKIRNYPLLLQRKGISIAIINFTYGTNAVPVKEWPVAFRMNEGEIAEAFSRALENHADFIIAIPHWGEEYELIHSATQEKWAKKLVEMGADAIIGSHPHVVQDSTHINGVPVIYSTGNAVSNMSATNTRLELAVRIRFVKDQSSGNASMLEPELRFMWCSLPGRLTDNYTTIFVNEWSDRRSEWLQASDYDNMIATYRNVKRTTHIQDEENH